jgi:hypothetical protein
MQRPVTPGSLTSVVDQQERQYRPYQAVEHPHQQESVEVGKVLLPVLEQIQHLSAKDKLRDLHVKVFLDSVSKMEQILREIPNVVVLLIKVSVPMLV